MLKGSLLKRKDEVVLYTALYSITEIAFFIFLAFVFRPLLRWSEDFQ